MRKVGVGIIGCGVISAAYLKASRLFPILDVKAVADMRSEAAEKRGAEFGVPGIRKSLSASISSKRGR
jgi:predicted dehydrogenase